MTSPSTPAPPGQPAEQCPAPGRVDGGDHSWSFLGDDPYIICDFCAEIRDALTGRTVKAARWTVAGRGAADGGESR